MLPEPEALLGAWCAVHRDDRGARWIPVARQAEYRARVVLAAFRPAGARSGESDWGTRPVVPMHRE
ncbi:hypothetical protein [Streptomyces sp. P3]|uniref:hypothetical protein n=1 Tax=Streptomyces sp. ID05-04B TaxID=3028661 RepID=UPI001C1FAD26